MIGPQGDGSPAQIRIAPIPFLAAHCESPQLGPKLPHCPGDPGCVTRSGHTHSHSITSFGRTRIDVGMVMASRGP
jgi:hypothetical protein